MSGSNYPDRKCQMTAVRLVRTSICRQAHDLHSSRVRGKCEFAAPAKAHCPTHESGYLGRRFNAPPCCTSHQGQQCAESGVDLPLNFHPFVTGARLVFTPIGDCGGQGPRVVGRGLVIQNRARAFGVIVDSLGGDHDPRMCQVAEHGRV